MRSFSVNINGIKYNQLNFYSLLNNDVPEGEKLVLFFEEWISGVEGIVQKTSGSTGSPKDIVLSATAMMRSAQNTNEFFNLSRNSNYFLCLPVEYIAGKMMLLRAMMVHGNVIVKKPTGNPFANLDDTIDFAAVTPFQLSKSYETLNDVNIKNMIVGGAAVLPALAHKANKLPFNVFETYGMTETCSHIGLHKISGNNKEKVFNTLPGVQIKTDNRDCLMIFADEITSDWIVTNDIVELIGDHSFKWLGRIDNVINSGGIKISPEALEEKVSSALNFPYYFNASHDDLLGEAVTLNIEGDHLSEKDEDLLNEKLKEKLKRFELPRKIVYHKKFKKTASGKIIRG